MILNILKLVGAGVTGFFSLKDKQLGTIEKSMEVVKDITATSQERDLAAARVLVAEAQSESWLTRTWRPLFMLVFMLMLLSYWFGYVPIQLTGDMPPIVAEIFTIIKIGLGGYIPVRGLEKIATKLQLGSIIKNFINKKVS